MKNQVTIAVLVLLFFGLNAQNVSQDKSQREYSILSALIGKTWIGAGSLMGEKATFAMEWQKVLGNNFFKLEFQNKRILEGDEYITFEATAFYKMVNDTTIEGNWFDNRGVSFPLKGVLKKNELTVHWGGEDTEQGKTIYHYEKNNEITVEDFVMNDGEYFKFGSARYKIKD